MVSVALITVSDFNPNRVQYHQPLVDSVVAQRGVEIEWLWVIPEKAISQWLVLAASVPEHITMRLVANPDNATVGARRNMALNSANAQLITTLDDDDVLVGECSLLARAEPVLAGAAWSAGHIVDIFGDKHVPWHGQHPVGEHVLAHEFRQELFSGKYVAGLCTATVMAPVETLRDVGGWMGELAVAEDLAMMMRLSHVPGQVRVTDGHVYGYRKHAHQVTSAEGFAQRDDLVLRMLRSVYVTT